MFWVFSLVVESPGILKSILDFAAAGYHSGFFAHDDNATLHCNQRAGPGERRGGADPSCAPRHAGAARRAGVSGTGDRARAKVGHANLSPTTQNDPFLA